MLLADATPCQNPTRFPSPNVGREPCGSHLRNFSSLASTFKCGVHARSRRPVDPYAAANDVAGQSTIETLVVMGGPPCAGTQLRVIASHVRKQGTKGRLIVPSSLLLWVPPLSRDERAC